MAETCRVGASSRRADSCRQLASSPRAAGSVSASMAALLTLLAAHATVELTSTNWDKEIGHKQAFVKFLAPW